MTYKYMEKQVEGDYASDAEEYASIVSDIIEDLEDKAND